MEIEPGEGCVHVDLHMIQKNGHGIKSSFLDPFQ